MVRVAWFLVRRSGFRYRNWSHPLPSLEVPVADGDSDVKGRSAPCTKSVVLPVLLPVLGVARVECVTRMPSPCFSKF